MENNKDIWDEESFNRRISHNEALAKGLIELFWEEVPKLKQILTEAVESSDVKGVFQAAHKLKGISANLSAARMKAAALELEMAAREENTALFGELSTVLLDELSVFLDVLKESYSELT